MSNTLKKIECVQSLYHNKSFQLSAALKIPVVLYHCNNVRDWAVNFISSSCEEIFEYNKNQFQSHKINIGNLINPEEQEMVWNTIQSAVKERCAFKILYQISTATQINKMIYEQGEGVFDQFGELIELVGCMSDVTNYCDIDTKNLVNILEKCAIEIAEFFSNSKHYSNFKPQLLSHREVETLVHLCQGKSMKEIGQDMHISSRTVEMNIRHAKNKMHCNNQKELRKLFYMTDSGKRLILLFNEHSNS